MMHNKITGPNAGGPRQFPIRTPMAARVGQFLRWAVMPRLALSIFIASLLAGLVGCSRRDDTHRGYDSKSGELGAFILRMAPKYGVRILTSNDLPVIPARWRFKADSNEFNLVVDGDYFVQLHTFLTRAVGPSLGSPTTNSPGELPGITAYYGTNLGVTVSCGSGKDDDGKQYTGFAIVNYGAANAGAGASSTVQYSQLLREVISELEQNPLKEFECHDKAVEHGVDSLTLPKEVERLFGTTNVDHFIWHFTGAAVWNSAAYFARRYTLTLRVPISIDYDRCLVKDVVGPAEVEVREVTKVDFYGQSGAPGATLKGYWRLNEMEWRSLVTNGGNWSVVNVPILSNAPVKGFDAYVNSVRDPIRYRKENFDKPVREAWEALRKRGVKTNTAPDSEKQNR